MTVTCTLTHTHACTHTRMYTPGPKYPSLSHLPLTATPTPHCHTHLMLINVERRVQLVDHALHLIKALHPIQRELHCTGQYTHPMPHTPQCHSLCRDSNNMAAHTHTCIISMNCYVKCLYHQAANHLSEALHTIQHRLLYICTSKWWTCSTRQLTFRWHGNSIPCLIDDEIKVLLH